MSPRDIQCEGESIGFSINLQSKTSDFENAQNLQNAEWNTVATNTVNVNAFRSSAHCELFKVQLLGAATKCIAVVTISISNTPINPKSEMKASAMTKGKENVVTINNNESVSIQSDCSRYSSFSEDIADNELNEMDSEYLSFSELISNELDGHGLNENDIDLQGLGGDIEFKWRMGIDVVEIGDFAASTASKNIICKFSNLPINGSNGSNGSTKPLDVVQSEEKAKSDGFCGYEVVLSANALYRHFTAYPVIIEFVDNHKNIVIGYSFIAFSLLLSSWTLESGTASTSTSGTNMKFSDKYYGIHSVRNNAVIRNMKSYDDLKAFEFDAVVMGNVRICCSLERFNIMNPTGISMDSRTGTDIEVHIEREHKVNGPEITESDQHRNSGISKANRSRSRNENQNEDDIDIEAVKFKRTENEIIGELKRWKTEQQQKWLNRLKGAEMERLHILETEFAKNEEIRSQQMRRQKLEIVKLEKKLKCSLYDVEGQEKKIKAEQSRLEDRRRELEQVLMSLIHKKLQKMFLFIFQSLKAVESEAVILWMNRATK